MPRYFFNLYNDLTSIDEEGTELPDLSAAEARGRSNARIMAAESVKEGHLTLHHRIEIADEDGAVLKIIPFSEVVAIQT
jgi:hypothetical protein